MKRAPYQDPQTSLERHIAELVEHLQFGTDSRSGFAQKIEAVMEHAFAVEAHRDHLARENGELRRQMAVPLPPITARSDVAVLDERHFFDWRIENIRHRVWLSDHHTRPDEKLRSRIRRQTFRELLKVIRERFEETYPIRRTPQ